MSMKEQRREAEALAAAQGHTLRGNWTHVGVTLSQHACHYCNAVVTVRLNGTMSGNAIAGDTCAQRCRALLKAAR